jgi:superfamily II DNA or RNA helicase
LSVMNTGWGPRTLGLRRNRLLKKVFAEYAMGRTRAEVRAQLPALQESLVELEPDRDWYKQYEKIKWNYRDLLDQQLTSTQSVLQNLRGYTQQVKLQAVCELIQDGCAENTLIYTYHRDLAKALGHLLNAPVVTGDLAPAKREEVARGHDFVVATFPSVAEGLDFSHMENIIYVEHDWQPGMLAQSLARVHRPGNDFSNVNVYHVVVKRTVDAVLYNTVKGRGATMQEIVDAALVPFDLGEGENDE